ncbi:hypothetical protein ACE0DR_28615 [Azotobacter sp. CWF10]
MSGELDMMRLIGPARERAHREMQNQRDMQEAINEANAAGAGITADLSTSLMAQAALRHRPASMRINTPPACSNGRMWAITGERHSRRHGRLVAGGLRDWSGLWEDMQTWPSRVCVTLRASCCSRSS